MIILGIESSCDDTSVALVAKTDSGFRVLAEKTASQIDIHKIYGGVVPEIAGRYHAEAIFPLIETVMAGQSKPNAIAVTAGPGLITGLLVGVEAAKALAYLWDIPLIGVNHIEGHIHSVELDSPIRYPALALVVSGGHTELVLMREAGQYERIGKTRDDAAGECFDKTAKLLGLPYPGGPKISALAAGGNTAAIDFPRPMLREDNLDFSFAGLKTSVLYWLRDHPEHNTADVCASLEQAIVDVLIGKTLHAAAQFHPASILLVGGVSANKKLRKDLEDAVQKQFPKTAVRSPKPEYCMDNAAMIAVAGHHRAEREEFSDWRTLAADPQWEVAP
jgi:N6-L-threonylcarbamoyladenine synthase